MTPPPLLLLLLPFCQLLLSAPFALLACCCSNSSADSIAMQCCIAIAPAAICCASCSPSAPKLFISCCDCYMIVHVHLLLHHPSKSILLHGSPPVFHPLVHVPGGVPSSGVSSKPSGLLYATSSPHSTAAAWAPTPLKARARTLHATRREPNARSATPRSISLVHGEFVVQYLFKIESWRAWSLPLLPALAIGVSLWIPPDTGLGGESASFGCGHYNSKARKTG